MADIREVTASCPACRTLETLRFKGDVLASTVKFTQRENGNVYHDCGTQKPCRLFAVMLQTGNFKYRRKVKR